MKDRAGTYVNQLAGYRAFIRRQFINEKTEGLTFLT